MRVFSQLVNSNSLFSRLNQHCFRRCSRSSSFLHDLEELIKQKDSFLNYIHFEYSVAIIYNVIMSISSLIYIKNHASKIFIFDQLSAGWLLIVSLIKLLESLPKGFLLYQTVRIKRATQNDENVVIRRLNNLIRSNIFYYNTVLSYCLLMSYSLYFLLIKQNYQSYSRLPQMYYIINMLIKGFFLRIVISFVNYHFHFKYGVNEADIANIDIYAENKCVKKEVLEKITRYVVTQEQMEKFDSRAAACPICLNTFALSEKVKVLPCNNMHVFHSQCIDTWLGNNVSCPTCRKEIAFDLTD